MKLPAIPRLYRRAIFIYLGTIVVPAILLVYLGIHTFELQRQNLAALREEKLAADLKSETLAAAESVFSGETHAIEQYAFTLEDGVVVRPALRSGFRDETPSEFREAEHLELDLNQWDQALKLYRNLAAAHEQKALAWSGVARCLEKLGRSEEARQTWRNLAASYADERDPSHRPYGIVAAIQAGDTEGLIEKIESGRWDLPGDQARAFLEALAPGRPSPYLDRFDFARELEEQFRPQAALAENVTYDSEFGSRRIFYRLDSTGRISGFSVNREWIQNTLLPDLVGRSKASETAAPEFVYAGAIGLAILVVTAGVLLLFRDVSREARTNRLRSDFVSSVSHELKTPITLIRLYSETLLRHAGLVAEERADFHRIIVRESERLTRLIDQVLTFSRVERGDQIYRLETGDVAPVIHSVVEDYREFLERSGFSLSRSLAESVPPVRFDATAMSQAILNLLDNAVKYSGQSKDIAVRLDVRGPNVTFEVEDHGVGIPAIEHQKIFDRFYRVPNGSGKGGYGLGLFMVRHVMEAHGGRAEVDSEPGRGSCFRLVLPVVTEWANTASS